MKLHQGIILLAIVLSTAAYAQQLDKAEKVVDEGIQLHDQGDYEGALKKYNQALELDKNNLSALAEKALTTLSLGRIDESIQLCKTLLELYPGNKRLANVYVNLGNAHDEKKELEKAIAAYDEGIKLFPDFHQLYFNKALALSGARQYGEAISLLQTSAMLNPNHPGSQNAMGRLLDGSKRVPSIFAYSRFLVLEPQSPRAKENLLNLKKAMQGNVEENKKGGTTISISSDILNQVSNDKEKIENDFSVVDMILSFGVAMNSEKKLKKKSEVEKFISNFEAMCRSLEENKEKNFGFYWEYYAPYFIEMNKRSQVETFAYIAFATSEDENVVSWINSHRPEIEKFYEWSNNFAWKTR